MSLTDKNDTGVSNQWTGDQDWAADHEVQDHTERVNILFINCMYFICKIFKTSFGTKKLLGASVLVQC